MRYGIPKLRVELVEARPNRLFSEAQRSLLRFMRYFDESGKAVKIPCAHCGRKKTVLWTQLCSFHALDTASQFGVLKVPADAKEYAQLTGVCQTHLLHPVMVEVDENGSPVTVPAEAPL